MDLFRNAFRSVSEEQRSILKQGVETWNKWREENSRTEIYLKNSELIGANLKEANLSYAKLENSNFRGADLSGANLMKADLGNAILSDANLAGTELMGAKLREADFRHADLSKAHLLGASLIRTDLSEANLTSAMLVLADLRSANLTSAKLEKAELIEANLWGTKLVGSDFTDSVLGATIFGNSDLSETIGLEYVHHLYPSIISADTFALSKGKIPVDFLRGCGLRDSDIEYAKLCNPDLNNNETNQILYKIHGLLGTQALQISPLFISYSHDDSGFVDKLEIGLNEKGIRFWRDIHDMSSGRIETQVDQAMRFNPTVLLILSEHSLQSDWVEHEVRTARSLEKEMKKDVLCPVALDDSWKNGPWAKRIMEQIMEYNILDFSEWKDDAKFENAFNKLINGLELFYR